MAIPKKAAELARKMTEEKKSNYLRKQEAHERASLAASQNERPINRDIRDAGIRDSYRQRVEDDRNTALASMGNQGVPTGQTLIEKATSGFGQTEPVPQQKSVRQYLGLEPMEQQEETPKPKSTLELLEQQREENAKKITEGVLPEKQTASVVNWLDSKAGQFNRGVTKTIDVVANAIPMLEGAIMGENPDSTLTGQLLKPLTDATGKLDEWTARETENATKLVDEAIGDNKALRLASDVGGGVITALPNAALAMMTGGASAGGTIGSQLAPQASGLAGTVSAAWQKLISNPMFQTSFIQGLGSGYEEAKEAGASDVNAMAAALLSTTANSIVEVGGGVETLPGELQNADLSTGKKALQWLTSALDEGKEEVVQGAISSMVNKAASGSDMPYFSMTDENAVVNPLRMGQEFGMGAAVGGILGGGQVLANSMLQKAYANRSGNGQDSATPSQAAPDSPLGEGAQGDGIGKLDAAIQETMKPTQELNNLNNAIDGLFAQNETAQADTGAESTNVNTNPAIHTPQEQAVIEEYQNAVDQNLVDFANGVTEGAIQNHVKYALNPVSDRAASDILRITGVDAKGFATVIEGRMIDHIVKRHGTNGTADHSMQDMNDIGRIQYVLDHYDNASTGGKSSAYVTVKPNGKTGQAQTVVFEKAVNGTYYVVEAVPDTKAKTTYVVSAYMSQDGAKKPKASQTADTGISPGVDVQNENANTFGNSTVSQSGTSVNGKSNLEQAVDALLPGMDGKPDDRKGLEVEGLSPDSEPPMSLGSASGGMDLYSRAMNKFGAISPGENPARIIDVPVSMDGESKVKRTVRTILESGITTDAVIPELQEEIVKGSFSAIPITDKGASHRAEATIQNVGYEQALADWRAEVHAGKVSKDSIALGETLYNAAVSAGDVKTAVQIAVDFASQVRSAAQALQAVRMLKQMSPAAQLYGVKQSVENLQQTLIERYGEKAPKLSIDEDLAANFLSAETEEAIASAEEALYKDIARQIPATFMDKWNAWRYLSMLGNPRTHIRNIVGNALFTPARFIKNQSGALMEAIAEKAGWIDKGQRTKRLGFNISKESRELVKAANEDYASVSGKIMSGGKYNSASDIINQNRRIFDTAALEALRKGNSYLLDLEDSVFCKTAYANSLAGYLKAQGFTAEDFRGEGMSLEQKDAARSYAIKEAQKATYRDINSFSEFVSGIGFKNPDNKFKKGTNFLVEGTMPFKRTPANILSRAAEYSPLGLAKTLFLDSWKVKNGDISAAEYIDNLSSGLTGLGVFALGAMLSNMGILVVGGGNDEDQFELEGHQRYSLEIGGKSITLDWIAPMAMPLFMGAELAALIGSGGRPISQDAINSFIDGLTEPLLEMSMMSSLQDALDATEYADNKIMAFITNAALGYLGQAVPTLFGQLERTFSGKENVRQTTFTQEGQTINKDTQYALGNILNKVPGFDYNQIPYIDAWGRKEENGPVWQRAVDNLFNPAYVSDVTETPVDVEIKRLEAQTGENLTPSRADKKITIDGETILLNAEEYVTYATAKGENDLSIRNNLIESDLYDELDDITKAKAMEYAKEYANVLAQQEAGFDPKLPQWQAELNGAEPYDVTKAIIGKALDAIGGYGDEKSLSIYQKNIFSPEWAAVDSSILNEALDVATRYNDAMKKIEMGYEVDTEWIQEAMELGSDKERSEYFLSKAIDSKALKTGDGKYDGLINLLDSESITDQTVLLVLPGDTVDKYLEYGKPNHVSTEQLLEIYSFSKSDDAKTELDENGDSIKGKTTMDKVIQKIKTMGVSRATAKGLFLSLYSEKNLPAEWK